MRPKSFQLSATSTAQSEKLGPALRSHMLINHGPAAVFIDFDKEVTTTTGTKLEPGASYSIEADFINLYYMTAGGSATLTGLKIIQ